MPCLSYCRPFEIVTPVPFGQVVSKPFADPTAEDPTHASFDDRIGQDGVNPWMSVKVQYVRQLDRLVTLRELKEHAASGQPLADLKMFRQPRLSVLPVDQAEWEYILALASKPESMHVTPS